MLIIVFNLDSWKDLNLVDTLRTQIKNTKNNNFHTFIILCVAEDIVVCWKKLI